MANTSVVHNEHSQLGHLGQSPAFLGDLFLPMLRKSAKQYGISQLANAVNKNATVLANELNPKLKEHKLGFETAFHICHIMADTSVFKLLAQELGLVLFEPPVKKLVDDKELVSCVTGLTKEVFDVCHAVDDAIADFEITPAELARVKKEATEAAQSLFQLVHRIEELTRH